MKIIFLLAFIGFSIQVSAQEQVTVMFGLTYNEVIDQMKKLQKEFVFDSQGNSEKSNTPYLRYVPTNDEFIYITYYFTNDYICYSCVIIRQINTLPEWLAHFNSSAVKTGDMEWVSKDGSYSYKISANESAGVFYVATRTLK